MEFKWNYELKLDSTVIIECRCLFSIMSCLARLRQKTGAIIWLEKITKIKIKWVLEMSYLEAMNLLTTIFHIVNYIYFMIHHYTYLEEI